MSRHFNGSSSRLEISTAVLTATPITMCAWINVDQLPSAKGDEMNIVSISDASLGDHFMRLRADDAADKIQYVIDGGVPISFPVTSTAVTAGKWHHATGVSHSASDHRVFIDGGSKGSDTTSVTPTAGNLDTTSIGVINQSTDVDFFEGDIADVAIWNIALSDEEIRLLAVTGMSPMLMRPENLVFYVPMHKAEDFDVINGDKLPRLVPTALTVGKVNPFIKHPNWFIPGQRVIVDPVNPPRRSKKYFVPTVVEVSGGEGFYESVRTDFQPMKVVSY